MLGMGKQGSARRRGGSLVVAGHASAAQPHYLVRPALCRRDLSGAGVYEVDGAGADAGRRAVDEARCTVAVATRFFPERFAW